MQTMTRVCGFPAVIGSGARILILGSMPGVASLQAQQYYAHPQNHFWRIMGDVVGARPALPYERRLAVLRQHGLAVWDVLQSCVRQGSLDAAIEHQTAIPNDLIALLRQHPRVVHLYCNGGTAHTALQRHFGKQLAHEFAHIGVQRLPSTSPANASWSYERKLAAWTVALQVG